MHQHHPSCRLDHRRRLGHADFHSQHGYLCRLDEVEMVQRQKQSVHDHWRYVFVAVRAGILAICHFHPHWPH